MCGKEEILGRVNMSKGGKESAHSKPTHPRDHWDQCKQNHTGQREEKQLANKGLMHPSSFL
jgi:hypothetical protein